MEPAELIVSVLAGASMINLTAAIIARLRKKMQREGEDEVVITINTEDGQEITLTRDQLDGESHLREFLARHSPGDTTSANDA
ncbi:hypothetical protein [Streptosporangium sp. NPDC002721]|uniref:hypothetical protein n=1 Tax=Streptosporangium sp. NPDC002721 TaxID=3366188 RepID=UPI00368C4B0B